MVRHTLVAVVLAIAPIAGAAPHAGKVVRVERAQGRPAGTPRLCEVSSTDLTAFCIGKRPELGDTIAVVDSRRVLATLRVESATPMGQCPQAPVTWMVQMKLESGDLGSTIDPQTMGLLDVALDSHGARFVKLEHIPGDRRVSTDSVWSLDSNGDGVPELAFIKTQCDDTGTPSSSPTGTCIEVWYPVGRQFELLRTDRIPQSCF